MTTPPGWYPDPGQTPQLPPQERWWDGSAWTAYTRPAGAPAPRPGGGGGRGPLIAGVVGGVVLIAALAVGSILLFASNDGPGPSEAGPESTPSAPERPGGGGDEPEDSGPPDDGKRGDGRIVATEQGVGIPVLEDWEQPRSDSAFVSSEREYECPVPQDSSGCVRGGATLLPVSSGWEGEDELKEATELQVAKHAKDSYPKKAYGGITSHKVAESGSVKVLGQPGYRVRWRIDNKKGPDAYVESVVFRSPHLPEEILTLWSSVDVADDAPPPSDLDKLRKGLVKTELGGEGGNGEAVRDR